jgi:hypothetical protein
MSAGGSGCFRVTCAGLGIGEMWLSADLEMIKVIRSKATGKTSHTAERRRNVFLTSNM